MSGKPSAGWNRPSSEEMHVNMRPNPARLSFTFRFFLEKPNWSLSVHPVSTHAARSGGCPALSTLPVAPGQGHGLTSGSLGKENGDRNHKGLNHEGDSSEMPAPSHGSRLLPTAALPSSLMAVCPCPALPPPTRQGLEGFFWVSCWRRTRSFCSHRSQPTPR